MAHTKTSHRTSELLQRLRGETINTWFDLGLFLDRLRTRRSVPVVEFNGSFDEYIEELATSGLAFISFCYSIDGVTIEVKKYARVLESLLPGVPIHFIAGKFFPQADRLLKPEYKRYQIEELLGFDNWPLYQPLFHTKLHRGDRLYNQLIHSLWQETLTIVEKLGHYIEEHNLKLLYPINVCSNPGNISAALALVLVSELLPIAVINNNHDFYWEGGSRARDIQNGRARPGPRDFFFTNSDIGELFTLLDLLYPWSSRTWINLNINRRQSRKLIERDGHNPANVMEICTAVDTNRFMRVSRRNNVETIRQIESILGRYRNQPQSCGVDSVLKGEHFNLENPKPILISNTHRQPIYLNDSIIFLQPTRVMTRKRIEQGFSLIERFLGTKLAQEMFKADQNMTLTLLITGPIASKHSTYLRMLIERFQSLLTNLPKQMCNRVYLGFLFSEFDRPRFKQRFSHPIGMPELYSVASLILLPSETEGRGLPIIEAAASARPIFCRRYSPEQVYAEVIGEHLPTINRLEVLEFRGGKISDRRITELSEWVFFPQRYTNRSEHNRRVVEERYSYRAMQRNLREVLMRLHRQLHPNAANLRRAARALERYQEAVRVGQESLAEILDNSRRHYLPGFGQTRFMLTLKSLIDPSYFRVEEQRQRGFVMRFARRLIEDNLPAAGQQEVQLERLCRFYNSVDSIFLHQNGEDSIGHDHSFAFRYRNRLRYPYRDLTPQELTGVVNTLFHTMVAATPAHELATSSNFFVNWQLALTQLANSPELGIDDRELLMERLQANITANKPIAYFPGKYVKYELEFFVLQSIRARLRLQVDQDLSEDMLKQQAGQLAPIYVFCREKPFGSYLTYEMLQSFIETDAERELQLLAKYELCKVTPTAQLSVGLHLAELGEEATRILKQIRDQKGFLIANGQHAAVMTDILDIDRFHLGQATDPIASNMLGIPKNSGFIQFVPAGIRATISYPTPVQTAKDLSCILKSEQYKSLCARYGQDQVLKRMRQEAATHSAPAQAALDRLEQGHRSQQPDFVEERPIAGLYQDGLPWSGVITKANLKEVSCNWRLIVMSANHKTKPVTEFAKEFVMQHGGQVRLAWNGGFILNAELIGKLGLNEAAIGSPLGLVVIDGQVLCPPLFNKPAMFVSSNNRLTIKRVSCHQGITITGTSSSIVFSPEHYNTNTNHTDRAFFDMLYESESLPAKGRTIIQLRGNNIHSITPTTNSEQPKRLPIGLTLLLPSKEVPDDWQPDQKITLHINELEDVKSAIEAGPLLIENGHNCINLEKEGWSSRNSILTQANRLDYADLRGPKIAAGLDAEGNLSVLAINSRIRESVGATYADVADILLREGIVTAMGFDPGGSSTLVKDGLPLNISPYNHRFEENVFSLPPEARTVASAVLLWIMP